MNMYSLIQKKRNGETLSKEEIHYMIQGYTKDLIPDYQMSAMMMAIYFRGMNKEETLQLTMEMAHSGETIDLSAIHGITVDKHSTGGVGDKTTLVLAPLVAACNLPVAKMSGRGLGHTGGTIDKLESFPGFTTSLTLEQFIHNVDTIQIAIAGQTANLAPADKKLYALRDVTATVEQMSLIASSIMSKKLSSGADAIVLDVKTGSGAFMKSKEDALALANTMVEIGKGANKKICALITNMDQPLGYAVGNALEVKEAIDTLQGKGPEDLTKLCLQLGAHMLLLGNKVHSVAEGEQLLQQKIEDGSGLNKLVQLIEMQNGNPDAVLRTDLLPATQQTLEIIATQTGYVKRIQSEQIGHCSMLLGGGRATKDSQIDLAVGIVLHKKVGDPVAQGESIATIHYNRSDNLETVKQLLLDAYQISSSPVTKPDLILQAVY